MGASTTASTRSLALLSRGSASPEGNFPWSVRTMVLDPVMDMELVILQSRSVWWYEMPPLMGMSLMLLLFHLGELFLTTFTDEFGLAVFTFSLNDVVVPEEGVMAFVNISKDGFFSYSYERMIFSYAIEEFDWEVAIALSPSLAENEMRIVLSWETSQDLDIYALQMDRATGDIVCKTYWLNMDGCEGIILDVDSRYGENGSETITWNEGSGDPYKYLLYVHDYSQLGFSESEARTSFYGEQVVKMEVEDCNNEDRYWMLGSFEPSEGISLFSIDGEFQTDNPDTSARSDAVARKP